MELIEQKYTISEPGLDKEFFYLNRLGNDLMFLMKINKEVDSDLNLTLFQRMIKVDVIPRSEKTQKTSYLIDLPSAVDISKISCSQQEEMLQIQMPVVGGDAENDSRGITLPVAEMIQPEINKPISLTPGAIELPIENIQNRYNILKKDPAFIQSLFSKDVVDEARSFHQQIPGYSVTPLHNLKNLARFLHVGAIWVKDESKRLNLNAFKVLGGSFAVAKVIQSKLGASQNPLIYSTLRAEQTRKIIGELVFSAATDGNHGRGVAWIASQLGYRSIIYVHHKTSSARIKAIEDQGAQVVVIDGTYDDAVHQVEVDSEKEGWQVISDTAYEGYEQIPTWVMQGYATMLSESRDQLHEHGLKKPTHILVQAGVGALAASAIGYYSSQFPDDHPFNIVVEPTLAPCLFISNQAGDGKPHPAEGDLDTIMAGLACGEPNPLAWKVLRDWTDQFCKCPDYVAALGMRAYAAPIMTDPCITSGESGALPLGMLMVLMRDDRFGALREKFRLDESAQILLINTEGNTDPDHYRHVVWEGGVPLPKLPAVNVG